MGIKQRGYYPELLADELLTPPKIKNEACKTYSSLSGYVQHQIRWRSSAEGTLRVTHHMHCRLHTEHALLESLTDQTLDKYAIGCNMMQSWVLEPVY